MTLGDLMPSLRGLLQSRLEPHLWPDSTRVTGSGDLTIAGISVTQLAARFGTPIRVVDRGEVRRRCRAYRDALPAAEIAFTCTAMPHPTVLGWMVDEGLSLAVHSDGELGAARSVGCPASRILLHNAIGDIDRLGSPARGPRRMIVAVDAARRVLGQPWLRLAGLHCHLGSHVERVADYELATRRMVGLMAAIRDEHGVLPWQLDLGGGHAVPQLAGQSEFDLTGFATRVRVALNDECERRGLPVPRLIIEPGRALSGPAGVTVHRVLAVRPGTRPIVLVDGDMSGDRQPVRLVGRVPSAPLRAVTVTGRSAFALPDDVRAGDLLAVPCTGAYHRTAAKDVAVAAGSAEVLVVRCRSLTPAH